VVGPATSAKRTKFSRLAWGYELYDLLCCAIDYLYEPELQVREGLAGGEDLK
jgi:hypothetical protein